MAIQRPHMHNGHLAILLMVGSCLALLAHKVRQIMALTQQRLAPLACWALTRLQERQLARTLFDQADKLISTQIHPPFAECVSQEATRLLAKSFAPLANRAK